MKKKNKEASLVHTFSKCDVMKMRSLDAVTHRAPQGMTDGTGRSMVEMLGVLAIIGVLSAGALKGY